MVKYYETTTIFNYNWDQVAQGFWHRYPNPHSKRLLSKTNHVPKWGERFYNAKSVKIVEESICDPAAKTLTTYTRNIAFTKVMSVVEKVVYKTSDEHPDKTVAVRSAWIDSQVFGFSRAIRAFGCERFKSNCSKMASGFNFVLSTMFPTSTTGVTITMPHTDHNYMSKATKLKEVAKKQSQKVTEQAKQIYQSYSVKN